MDLTEKGAVKAREEERPARQQSAQRRLEQLGTFLSAGETRRAVKLLGLAQEYLEGAIENAIVPGSREPREKWLRPIVAQDRKHPAQIKELTERIEFRRRERRRASRP